MAFSVLISVYQREKPQYLEQALESLLEQTLLPTEVVIVEDGPLTDELYAVIEAFKTRFAATVSVVLPRNVGLGLALNHGLKECHYPIVARMDSDDICKPRRFEKQLEILRTHKEIDVVGSWIDEFLGTKENIISTRKVPETHQEILHFARYRNPMNHPTVMFRKAVIEAVDSYHDFSLFEDYDLWVRMLQQGACFHNLQECLLWFRLNANAFRRRGGWHYIAAEIGFQKTLVRRQFLTPTQALGNIVTRLCVRLLPTFWRRKFYMTQLRATASVAKCSPKIIKEGGSA